MHYRFQHALKFSTCFFNTTRFSMACTLYRDCIQIGPIFSSFQDSFFIMPYRFQHTLKFSTCFFNTARFSVACTLCRSCIQTGSSFQHALKISICAEIFYMLFQHAFNMHYRFQHALQISTCSEIFNMFSTYFKHEIHLCYEPC